MKKLICIFMITLFIYTNTFAESITFNDKVYNLVTSFIGDASSERGFAWTACKEYDDMVLKIRKTDETEETIIIPEVTDKGEWLYYKADVRGLLPDSRYTYKIGDKTKAEWFGPFEFHTKAEEVKSFKFIGLCDSQGSTKADFEFFRNTVKTAYEDVPDADFIINVGDLVSVGFLEQEWKWHFDAISDVCVSVPYMGVVGNHDVSNPMDGDSPEYDEMWDVGENFSLHLNHPDNGSEAVSKKLENENFELDYFKEIAENIKETVYSFDLGSAHFTVLNTITYNTSDDYRKILQAQREWLEEDFKNSDAKWKIVVFHMGAYRADSFRDGEEDDIIRYFTDIIDKYGADLVLQGHDHIYMRTYPISADRYKKEKSSVIDTAKDGVVYSVLGSAANKRYGDDRLKGAEEYALVHKNTAYDMPVYCVFEVSESKIHVTAKQIDGTVIDEYTLINSNDNVINAGKEIKYLKNFNLLFQFDTEKNTIKIHPKRFPVFRINIH